MAPSLTVPATSSSTGSIPVAKTAIPPSAEDNNRFGYEPGRTPVERHDTYAYEDLLPSFPTDLHYGPLGTIPYTDRGTHGNPKFRNLLRDATAIFDYTPKIGTEIHGVNLAKLSDSQKDDLARLIATRGVVFFRQQDDFDIETQRNLGRYYGEPHKVRWGWFYITYDAFGKFLTDSSMQQLLFRGRKVLRISMWYIQGITQLISERCIPQASCGIRMYI